MISDDFKIINGDCLEVMREMSDSSVDAIITDPPYGTTACKWDSVIPFDPMWKELKRLAKPNAAIVLFGSQPFTSALVMSNPKMFRYEWIWDKGFSGNFIHAHKNPLKRHETVSLFSVSSHMYIPQMVKRANPIDKSNWQNDGSGSVHYSADRLHRSNLLTHSYPQSIIREFNAVSSECNNTHRQHPTQKPVELIRYLVRTYTEPGQLVLDFTMGSGTTGVACAIEGRRFIGIELDEHYCQVGEARIRRALGEGVDIPRREAAPRYEPLFETTHAEQTRETQDPAAVFPDEQSTTSST